MKTLVADDDFTSRLLLQKILEKHGTCHIAANGRETVEAARMAIEEGEPYDLVCLDIMMPEMDGQEALGEIRRLEETMVVSGKVRAKIIMTTALADKTNVTKAGERHCDGYLVKPIQRAKLEEHLRKLELIP
jgi:two-component system chemotaxis response regulator CheY